VPDRLTRLTTAFVVVGVAAVAAIVSYEHAYFLVRAHGEDGWTARLVPLTVDGLIYASSMVMLQAARRRVPMPALAVWLLALGIVATLAANVMHGLGHGPVGAAVAAWPAIALVGSYELLMVLVRNGTRVAAVEPDSIHVSGAVPAVDPLLVQAADVFAGVVPSIRAIRAALHVGQPRAQQIQAYLEDIHGSDTTHAPSIELA
jgi:hypothetical protein